MLPATDRRLLDFRIVDGPVRELVYLGVLELPRRHLVLEQQVDLAEGAAFGFRKAEVWAEKVLGKGRKEGRKSGKRDGWAKEGGTRNENLQHHSRHRMLVPA